VHFALSTKCHGFSPEVCLINRYVPGARMSLHQDKDENDFGAPIVSVSHLSVYAADPANREDEQ